jgi:hypothetical protein
MGSLVSRAMTDPDVFRRGMGKERTNERKINVDYNTVYALIVR